MSAIFILWLLFVVVGVFFFSSFAIMFIDIVDVGDFPVYRLSDGPNALRKLMKLRELKVRFFPSSFCLFVYLNFPVFIAVAQSRCAAISSLGDRVPLRHEQAGLQPGQGLVEQPITSAVPSSTSTERGAQASSIVLRGKKRNTVFVCIVCYFNLFEIFIRGVRE
jgi:hypothetical protein